MLYSCSRTAASTGRPGLLRCRAACRASPGQFPLRMYRQQGSHAAQSPAEPCPGSTTKDAVGMTHWGASVLQKSQRVWVCTSWRSTGTAGWSAGRSWEVCTHPRTGSLSSTRAQTAQTSPSITLQSLTRRSDIDCRRWLVSPCHFRRSAGATNGASESPSTYRSISPVLLSSITLYSCTTPSSP